MFKAKHEPFGLKVPLIFSVIMAQIMVQDPKSAETLILHTTYNNSKL